MKRYEGVGIQLHIFLTLVLAGGEWSASHHSHLTAQAKSPSTCCIGDWVGPRIDLEDMERITIFHLMELQL
jgi:hypothetical protein